MSGLTSVHNQIVDVAYNIDDEISALCTKIEDKEDCSRYISESIKGFPDLMFIDLSAAKKK